MEESRVDKVKRFSKIWWQSRSDAGKSQEFMALGLGVSKKTIQNWEKGISSPNLFQSLEWFELLGLNPMNYYLIFLYPFLFDGLSPTSEDEQIEAAFNQLISNFTPMEKRQLLYIITGEHGSSWYSLLQLFTAHCHNSLQARVTTASTILENYEMENYKNTLVCPEHIKPDLDNLKHAINMGKEAVKHNATGYTTLTRNNTDTIDKPDAE